MHKFVHGVGFALLALFLISPAHAFDVTFGVSWDAVSLQSVLDAEYGA